MICCGGDHIIMGTNLVLVGLSSISLAKDLVSMIRVIEVFGV